MNNEFNTIVAMNGGDAGRNFVRVANLPLPTLLPLPLLSGSACRGLISMEQAVGA